MPLACSLLFFTLKPPETVVHRATFSGPPAILLSEGRERNPERQAKRKENKMCKVKEMKDREKKVTIVLNDGRVFESEWKPGPGRDVEEICSELMEKYHVPAEDLKSWAVRRQKREEDTVYITDHAMTRMKERNGWGRKAAIRMVQKVFDNGTKAADVRKGPYKAWAHYKAEKALPNENLILYGDKLYIFAGKVLITVIPARAREASAKEKWGREEY